MRAARLGRVQTTDGDEKKRKAGESRHGCKKGEATEGGDNNVTYDRPLASVYYRFPKLISNSRGSVADGRGKGKKGEGPERELADRPRVASSHGCSVTRETRPNAGIGAQTST